jgi:hypothetical protein
MEAVGVGIYSAAFRRTLSPTMARQQFCRKIGSGGSKIEQLSAVNDTVRM